MSTNSYAESPNTLSDPKNFILGLQHLIAMFGATVLVPILTGFNPSVALFTAGCGTLIFHACTNWKVPVFLGSSFAFIPLIIQVKALYQGDLAYAQGGIIVAGFIYVLLSLFVKKVGVDHIKAFLPAHVVGPMIIVIGLNLVPTAFGMAKANFMLAGVTLATALVINFLGKGFLKQLSILIAVIVGYTLSLAIHAVDFTSIQQAALFGIPAFTFPKFSLEAILIIAPVVLAVFMEHVGDITTNGTVVGQNFIENPGLHRTLLGDGIATMFAGFLGGPANTTYGENTGVLAITKNYNPAILRIAAVFAIVLSLVGKLGGVLGSIPTAVMGGISLMLFSMIALIGVKTIKDQKVAFNFKNIVIMLLILCVGLAPSYVPSLALKIAVPNSEVALSGLSLAALLGVIVNSVWSKLES
ncbi:uracil-xanthine permease family protein [Fusibacter sp. 3D3]|uniref:uracil-xanthine permease family protein n=1 Tax=Fusibacter sp. 3D3 TaxID=1048380 RepID=UPI0008538EB2|nr:uracil-xanthine permease family protein [Fusibacter sp. 3D3]GAU77634.1 uracil permease [Fusibacter sp. 3D3]